MFELYQSPITDESGKHRLYVRPVIHRKVTMGEVDAYCARNRGMRRGQVIAAMNCFVDVCKEWLADGCRVETPLGVFSPRLRLVHQEVSPKEVSGKDVRLSGIRFSPSKRFITLVADEACGFRRMTTQGIDDSDNGRKVLAEALRRSLVSGFTTVRLFQIESRLKYATARTYLDNLSKGPSPLLSRQKIGTTYHYFPLEGAQSLLYDGFTQQKEDPHPAERKSSVGRRKRLSMLN